MENGLSQEYLTRAGPASILRIWANHLKSVGCVKPPKVALSTIWNIQNFLELLQWAASAPSTWRMIMSGPAFEKRLFGPRRVAARAGLDASGDFLQREIPISILRVSISSFSGKTAAAAV